MPDIVRVRLLVSRWPLGQFPFRHHPVRAAASFLPPSRRVPGSNVADGWRHEYHRLSSEPCSSCRTWRAAVARWPVDLVAPARLSHAQYDWPTRQRWRSARSASRTRRAWLGCRCKVCCGRQRRTAVGPPVRLLCCCRADISNHGFAMQWWDGWHSHGQAFAWPTPRRVRTAQQIIMTRRNWKLALSYKCHCAADAPTMWTLVLQPQSLNASTSTLIKVCARFGSI